MQDYNLDSRVRSVARTALGRVTKDGIAFDLPTSVASRDVAPDGFTQANPDRRVIEARLEISTRIWRDEDPIEEMTIEFVSPEGRWAI